MTLATVLVTGSSSGLGRRTAETLARRGFTVFASMRGVAGKNAGVANELRALASAEGLALEVIELDVTDESSVQSAVQTIIERAGRIDAVVNNAGYGVGGISEAMSVAQVQQLFDVNVFGALRVNQAVLPHMRRQRSGLLIYVASTASRVVFPALGMYSATKAALDAMARGFAYEIQGFGIDTTIIQAGGFATEFGHNLAKSSDGDIWSEYGAVAQFATAFVDNMSAALAPGLASDPQLLANLAADLVAMPAGARPLHTAIGLGSEGVPQIDQLIQETERQTMSAFGMGQFIQPEPAATEPVLPEALEGLLLDLAA